MLPTGLGSRSSASSQESDGELGVGCRQTKKHPISLGVGRVRLDRQTDPRKDMSGTRRV